MKKRIIPLVILLTTVSLVGIIVTRILLVRQSMEEQSILFQHRVQLSVAKIVDNILEGERRISSEEIASFRCRLDSGNIQILVSPAALDSMVKHEFPELAEGKDYSYGILKLTDTMVVMGNGGHYGRELIQSPYQSPLSCFRHESQYSFSVYFPNQNSIIVRKTMPWIVSSSILLIFMALGLCISIYLLMRQKRLSEIKADFLNNMTHEFKTPLATISLASEMLQSPAVLNNQEKASRYANIISSEISRLKKHVEQILQMAVLDKADFRIRKREVDVHRIIEYLVKSFSIIVKQRKGSIQTDLAADKSVVYADREQLTNVISNLLDNAEKYSHCAPQINIRTYNYDSGIVISVTDKGIGISEEAQKEIFKKHYRFPDERLQNVKGFGLGLYYVQKIVEAHKGRIQIQSAPRQGSQFEIFLPFNASNIDPKKDEEQVNKNIIGRG